MKVFLTGGTGYLGSAIAERLAGAGHDVVALARSDASAKQLEAKGFRVVRGDTSDDAAIVAHATRADAMVHTANTQTDKNPQVDGALARGVVGAYEGTSKPFVYTSGVWSFRDTGETPVHEASPADPLAISAWRIPVERDVLAAGGIVLRPGIVYGRGAASQGIPGMLVEEGVSSGRVRYIGDGFQEWPLVHVDDLADLYVRGLDAPRGSVLHGIGPSSASMRDIALAASYAAGVPGRVEAWPIEAARASLGHFADALAASQRISSARTRALTGWAPAGPTIFEEMLTGSYAPASRRSRA